MIFLPLIELGVASEIPHELVLPLLIEGQIAVEQNIPVPIDKETSLEKEMLLDLNMKVKPFVLEGSVENFDPAERALELVKTLPRSWCGTYSPFKKGSEIDVRLTFSKVYSTGQIVDLYGEMLLGSVRTKVYGHLNAKSDQMELIPLGSKLVAGLDPGGSFVGLQGVELFGWQPSTLDNQGGTLQLNQDCNQKFSKPPAVRAIW